MRHFQQGVISSSDEKRPLQENCFLQQTASASLLDWPSPRTIHCGELYEGRQAPLQQVSQFYSQAVCERQEEVWDLRVAYSDSHVAF